MIAITGANGLLGSYILRKLVSENKRVIALHRKNSDRSLINDLTGVLAVFRHENILLQAG